MTRRHLRHLTTYLVVTLGLLGLEEALASGHGGILYKECGMTYGFPLVYSNEFEPPQKLTVEQKARLVTCADKARSAAFSKWVAKELRDDIRKGLVAAPGAVAPMPREMLERSNPAPVYKTPSMFDEMGGMYPVLFAAVALVIGVIVAIVIVIRARMSRDDS